MKRIEGQLNPKERQLLTDAILQPRPHPQIAVEVGTWLGGGSTLHILRALETNGVGHLWGIEADPSIYERMLSNIKAAAPESVHRFTPMFGFSQMVIPRWLEESGESLKVDFAFLDGGNNPLEQIDEFHCLNPHIPVGGQIMGHDAKLRKGRFLVPYMSLLDNWECSLHDVSDEGLFQARKVSAQPSTDSIRRAKKRLRQMQCNPIEIAANILPSGLCSFFLKLLPRKFSRRLSDGRK